MWPAPSWLDSSVGRALPLVSKRSWVRILFRSDFFQALISQLAAFADHKGKALGTRLRWSVISSYLSTQFKYMIFDMFIGIAVQGSQMLVSRFQGCFSRFGLTWLEDRCILSFIRFNRLYAPTYLVKQIWRIRKKIKVVRPLLVVPQRIIFDPSCSVYGLHGSSMGNHRHPKNTRFE